MAILNYLSVIMHFMLVSLRKATSVHSDNSFIYVIACFMFIISMIPKSLSELHIFSNYFYRYVSIIMVFFITFGILVCGYIKKKLELKKGENSLEEIH